MIEDHKPTDVVVKQRNPQGRFNKKLGRAITADERKLALEVVVLCGGNCSEASRQLNARGLPISGQSLATWTKTTYADEYQLMRYELREQIDRHVHAQARDLVIGLGDLERAAMAKSHAQLEADQVKDASTVLRNATVSKSINLEKIALHEGKPTSITESRSGDELLRALADLGRVAFIDSTAEDVE